MEGLEREEREWQSERRGEELGRDVMFGNVTSFKHCLFNNVSVVNAAEDNGNTDLKM